MRNLLLRTFTLVMLSSFVVSCGSQVSNVLNGVKVKTETVEDDLWMSFAADINLGSMTFASIALPILHPRGQTPIGQLELVSGLNGVNQLKVSLNVTELADIRATEARLPNGNLIPLIGNNQTIAISIGGGARVYLTISETVTAIGVAVPIKAFDDIGESVPGLNFFPMVSTDNVVGTAGIFTSAKAGQNGIAVVADVSKVVNLGSMLNESSPMMAIQAEEAKNSVKLDYRSQSISSAKKATLDQMIYNLNKRKAVLRIK